MASADVLAALADSETPLTVAELPASRGTVERLVEDGLVKPAKDVRRTGSRGRPATQYGLTAKGKRKAEKAAVAA